MYKQAIEGVNVPAIIRGFSTLEWVYMYTIRLSGDIKVGSNRKLHVKMPRLSARVYALVWLNRKLVAKANWIFLHALNHLW